MLSISAPFKNSNKKKNKIVQARNETWTKGQILTTHICREVRSLFTNEIISLPEIFGARLASFQMILLS